jgi:hypothetical protein
MGYIAINSTKHSLPYFVQSYKKMDFGTILALYKSEFNFMGGIRYGDKARASIISYCR